VRKLLFLLPVVLAGGCETTTRPYSPVENVRYTALGHDPFWMVTIGDDRIVLRQAQSPGQPYADAVFPRTLPRTVDGVRTWQSGGGTAVISIEATRVPCQGSGARIYEDQVRVRLSGRELTGCGGRLVERRRG
jgi:uncharacterized membrane protein